MPLPATNPTITKPHDIRTRIPLTKFTNPAEFPMHVHREFPKMLLRSNPDPKARQKIIPYTNDIDQPMLVMDQVDMDDFLESIEDEELRADILKCTPKSSEDRLEEENAAMRKLISENEDLQRRLAAAEARANKGPKEDKPKDVNEAEEDKIASAPKVASPSKAKPKPGSNNKSVPSTLKARK